MRQNGHAQIQASGSSGGIIVAWKSNKLTGLQITTLQHSISIEFKSNFDHAEFKLTAVYGPPSQTNRQAFFSELRSQKSNTDKPWILLGDFNQTLNVADRSNVARGPDRAFVALVAGLELIDLPLKGRRYTWSRGINNPSFVRLDRFLISTAWNTQFPNTIQKALHSILSDHYPLQCIISTKLPLPNTFRFENYWLKMQHFKDLVVTNWQTMQLAHTPIQLAHKLQTLRKEIRA